MAMDFATLAQLTRPQMMGNAPIGGGGLAGHLYGQDVNRHDAMLAQAAQMAQLDAQRKAMEAEEFALGAPGRRAQTEVTNALAQGRLSNLPTELDVQRKDLQGKSGKLDQERISRELDILGKYADQYLEADELGKQEVINQMKADGVTRVGNRTLDEIQQAGRMDALMQRVRKARVNTPQFEQKRLESEASARAKSQLEERKLKAKENVARWANEARIKQAEIIAKARKEGKRIDNPNYIMFQHLWDKARTQEEKDAVHEWYQRVETNVASARAASGPMQLDIDPNNPNQPITARPPQVPEPVAPPKVGQGRSPDDPRPGIDTFNGKTIKRIARDPKTGKVIKVQLEDGSIHDYR